MKRIYGLLIIMMVIAACTKPKEELPNDVKIISTSVPNSFKICKVIYFNGNHKTSKSLSIAVVDTDSMLIPIDTIPTLLKIKRKPVLSGMQYIKFQSFLSEDKGQANIDEIEVYCDGVNIALNKPSRASSTQLTSMHTSCGFDEFNVNDGNLLSRWSSDRNIDSYNTAEYVTSPSTGWNTSNVDWAHIMIDFTQEYLIDSVRVFLYQTGDGADLLQWQPWKQTFNLSVSLDTINWTYIGGGIDTTELFLK